MGPKRSKRTTTRAVDAQNFIVLGKNICLILPKFLRLCGLSCYLLFYFFRFRPIAGHANLCPNSISVKRQELEILLSTVKHEILHALGFSVSLYAFYRDENGDPLTPRRPDTKKPLLNEM